MALLCTCNIVAIGNLFFSLRTSKVLPVFLFLASGSAAVAVAMGAGAGGAGAEHGTDIQRRARRERGGEETAFLSEIGADEMEGREKGGRNGKGKKQRRQKMYLGGFFRVTREPTHELPSFRCPETLPAETIGYLSPALLLNALNAQSCRSSLLFRS